MNGINEIKASDSRLYTSDSRFDLVNLTEADKEQFFLLLEQTNAISDLSDKAEFCEMMWKLIMQSEVRNYSIYNKAGEYCGNIILKKPETSTPEIGIELITEKRNQGIAPSCIKLLARTVHRERIDVEYFVLRVSSKNLHSKHMIEKLGAVFDGEEDTLNRMLMKRLMEEERAKECENKERRKELDDILNELNENDEVVYRYKLMSDIYM